MFNLDQAIAEWCAQVARPDAGAESHYDELSDHFYCMVEHLQTQGHREEAAFERARNMLGDPQILRREFSKNRNWKQALCAALKGQMTQRYPEEIRMKENFNRLQIGNAILWAAAMIGTALVLRGNEAADNVFMLLFVLSMASTLGLQQMVNQHNKVSACSEWRWMMRQIKRLQRPSSGSEA